MKKILLAILCLTHTLVLFAKENNLQFIENKNQWDAPIKYKADVPGGHIFLTNNYFRYGYFNLNDLESIHEQKHKDYTKVNAMKVNCYTYDLQFLNANANPALEPQSKLSNYYNYFLGNNPAKWAGNVAAYQQINYINLYQGIDIHAYSNASNFKYDIIIHPNANVQHLQMKYKGIVPTLNNKGQLVFDLGFYKMMESIPYTYQIINGKRKEVVCKYAINNMGEISFEFPEGYLTNTDLIIDPVLVFATYSGSTATTYGFSATYDNSGNLYAGGECFGIGWPSTVGAFQMAYSSGVDAGINKYNAAGTTLIYSTYFGGTGSDLPNNMVVNSANELAITGSTTSSNMPTTLGCYDNTLGGNSDAFVARFNAAGSALIGATYIGGSGAEAQNNNSLSPNYGDQNRGEIFYDIGNQLVVAASTSSTDFPTTAGTYQTTNGGGQDGCFFKLDGACTSLIFSTYLGGSGNDACFSLVKNSGNNWVICGGTASSNFPTTAGSFSPTQLGGTDGFVTIFNNTATAVFNSTYIGTTNYDHAFKVQVDMNDTIYICGQTDGAFLVTPGVYSNANGYIFIQKLASNLNTVYASTTIGNGTSGSIVPTAFLKDNCGNIYFAGVDNLSGSGSFTGMPLTANAYQSAVGGFWMGVFNTDLTALTYATYYGDAGAHVDGGTSRFDPLGIVYHSVCTSSSNVYNSAGSYAPNNLASSYDVASFKFDFQLAGANAFLAISPNDSGCIPYTVAFNNNGSAGTGFIWYFGDGDSSLLPNPSHTYTVAGVFNVMMIALNPTGCVSADTAYVVIKVLPTVSAAFTKVVTLGCKYDSVSCAIDSVKPGVAYSWSFGDGGVSTSTNPSYVYNTQGIYNITCIATNGMCSDTVVQVVNVLHPIQSTFFTSVGGILKDSLCLGETINVVASGSSPQNAITLTYNLGDGIINTTTASSLSHDYNQSGEYLITVSIIDNLGCKDTAKQSVYVDQPAFIDDTISAISVCQGEPLFLEDTIAPHTISFEWNFGDGTNVWNIHHPTHTYTNSGNYTITLTGNYLVCAPMAKSIAVNVDQMPSVNLDDDTAICPDVTGALTLQSINTTATSYLWNTGEVSNKIIVSEPGLYWLQASIGNCTNADSILISRDCYLNIPNSFTPDNDGLNDYFLPRDFLSAGLTSFSMEVFNRWGELVFTTSNVNGKGWDGKYGAKTQPIGTYVYKINAVFKNSIRKTYTGNVTLLR